MRCSGLRAVSWLLLESSSPVSHVCARTPSPTVATGSRGWTVRGGRASGLFPLSAGAEAGPASKPHIPTQ